uniref:RING-type domain-containing protein n=1 Tax=Globodera pallida TaxID=36090 RepID=A0A183BY84_GLOPA
MVDVSEEEAAFDFDLDQLFNDTIVIIGELLNDWRQKVCCKWAVLIIAILAVGGLLMFQFQEMSTKIEQQQAEPLERQNQIQFQNLSQQIEQQMNILKSLVMNEQYSDNFWQFFAISTLAIALLASKAKRWRPLLLSLLKWAMNKFWIYPILITLVVIMMAYLSDRKFQFQKMNTKIKQQKETFERQHQILGEELKVAQTKFSLEGERELRQIEEVQQSIQFQFLSQQIEQQTHILKKLNCTNRCVICFWQQREYAFIPCGHFCVCEPCSNDIMTKAPICPMCRGQANGTIRIYQS